MRGKNPRPLFVERGAWKFNLPGFSSATRISVFLSMTRQEILTRQPGALKRECTQVRAVLELASRQRQPRTSFSHDTSPLLVISSIIASPIDEKRVTLPARNRLVGKPGETKHGVRQARAGERSPSPLEQLGCQASARLTRLDPLKSGVTTSALPNRKFPKDILLVT